MFIDVALVPDKARRWHQTMCIVVDMLRASFAILTALDWGCRTVKPFVSMAEARRLAHEHGYILVGERDGVMSACIDYGNSPVELAAATQRQPELRAALEIWGVSEAGVKGAYDLMRG